MIIVHQWMKDRLRLVCLAMGVSVEEVLTLSCTGRVVRGPFGRFATVRAITAYLMRVAPHGVKPSWWEVAAALGFGSHSSAINACRSVETDPELLAKARRIADAIGVKVPRGSMETPAA